MNNTIMIPTNAAGQSAAANLNNYNTMDAHANVPAVKTPESACAAMTIPDSRYPYDENLRLSPHFTLKELTRSAAAVKYEIENVPSLEEIARLRALCENVLEPLRRRFGVIRITSGFRTQQLNERIGGARNSQHLYGEAADIYVGSKELGKKMYMFIRENIVFDQLLLEVKGKHKTVHCIHISFKSDRGSNRRYCKMEYAV